MHQTIRTLTPAVLLAALASGCSSTKSADPGPSSMPAEPPAETTAEMEAPMVEGHVTITSDHLVIDDKIKFASNSAELDPASFELLDDVAAVLSRHPEIGVLHVIGHTDDTGERSYNLKLSADRAQSVVDYLQEKGVTQPIDARGAGPDEPQCTEATADCRAKNRRVEFLYEPAR